MARDDEGAPDTIDVLDTRSPGENSRSEFIIEYSVQGDHRVRFRVRPRVGHGGAWLYEEEMVEGEWKTIGRAPIYEPNITLRDMRRGEEESYGEG